MLKTLTILTTVVLTTGFLCNPAASSMPQAGQPGTAEQAADRLFDGLRTADEGALRELLDPQVVIFESGGVESSLEEYASHHMGSDMVFMQGIEREVMSRNVQEDGGLAVVTTRSRLTGTYRDRPVDLFSNETLVLEKRQGRWSITHIHWSSR